MDGRGDLCLMMGKGVRVTDDFLTKLCDNHHVGEILHEQRRSRGYVPGHEERWIIGLAVDEGLV